MPLSQEGNPIQEAYFKLKALEEDCGALFNVADMVDSTTFSGELGGPGGSCPGPGWGPSSAYGMALQRPSATACAYINEGQLRIIRAISRAFCITNPYWMAVKRSRIDYVVGTGHIRSIVPKNSKEKKWLTPDRQDAICDELEDFDKINRYRHIQGEKLTRLDRDGEYFLRKVVKEGKLLVSFVEPILIVDPPGHGPQDNCWFGVQYDGEDYSRPTGYYIRPTNYDGGQLSADQEEQWNTIVPADEIQRRTANVDSNSPRGLPSTYTLQPRLEQALSTLKSMGRLVDIRARLAVIKKHINATLGTITPMLFGNRSGTKTGPGGVPRNAFQYPYGSIVDTNDQTEFQLPTQGVETDKIVMSVHADIQSVASAMGLTDFCLGASSGGKFSEALVKEGPMDKSVSCAQQDLIDDDIEIYEADLEVAAEEGRVDQDTLEHIKITVEPPVVIRRNRIQDKQADEILVRNGSMSRRTMATRDNLDFEDEETQIKLEGPSPMALLALDNKRSQQAGKDGKVTARGVPSGQEPGPSQNNTTMAESLLESSHEPYGKSLPSTSEMEMAGVWLTPEWLEQTKREILSLPDAGMSIKSSGVVSECEPGVQGCYLGTVNNRQVWGVDADAMMIKHDAPDFIVAGNYARCPWVPADKIFIDWSYCCSAAAHDLYHDCCEATLMAQGKWSYAMAHKIACALERQWILDLRPDLKSLQSA